MSKILRHLLALTGVAPIGIVEDGGGAALDDDPDVEQHDDAADDAGDQAEQDQRPDNDEASGSDEDVITLGDEQPEESHEEQARAPEWVRELRKSHRDTVRRVRELEAENAKLKGGATQSVTLGVKPTLAGCDFDEDKFDAELSSWHERRRQIEQQQEERKKAEESQRTAWAARLDAYSKEKAALRVRDFEDVEAVAQEALSVTQQGIILNGADKPAPLIYALGRNPKKLKELAGISDPVKFAFAVAKLETQMKIAPKKPSTAPERTIRGSAPGSSAVDSTLERLRADAEKTGDMTKVIAYKRQLRDKGR